MKSRCGLHGRSWSGVLILVAVFGVVSCQRLLGIHSGGGGRDAGLDADVLKDVGGPQDQSPADEPAVVGDAGGADAVDAKETDGAAKPDAVPDGAGPGPDSAQPADAIGDGPPVADAADAGAAADRPGASDGGGSDGPSAGDASVDVASGDAGACAPAWHAENVEARLLTPGTSATACSIAAADIPMLAAAVDGANFRGAQACGACLRVQGALNSNVVTVPVVERSGAAGILLTRAAMDQISPGGSLIAVDWWLVPCDTKNQPLRYYIKEGSNAGYVGIQVRNARYPIASVSAVGTSTSVPLALQTYNYWESTAVGAGPLTLRVVDINGQSVQDPGIKVVPQTETAGQSQFPVCR